MLNVIPETITGIELEVLAVEPMPPAICNRISSFMIPSIPLQTYLVVLISFSSNNPFTFESTPDSILMPPFSHTVPSDSSVILIRLKLPFIPLQT